jgi:O-methyltransferase
VDREKVAETMAAAVRRQAREAFSDDIEGNRVILAALDNSSVWSGIASFRSLRDVALALRSTRGAFVECGVAQGTSLVVMAALAGPDRLVWGFDSFEGFPELSDADGGSGAQFVGMACAGAEGEGAVYNTFAAADVPMTNVRLVKGWFVDTVPGLVDQIGPIALLRLDSDFHDATRFTLEQFYEQVVPGGIVIVNDYFAFEGCRKAVDDFRAERGIDSEIHVTSPHNEVHWFV